jgi:hypothetical protein
MVSDGRSCGAASRPPGVVARRGRGVTQVGGRSLGIGVAVEDRGRQPEGSEREGAASRRARPPGQRRPPTRRFVCACSRTVAAHRWVDAPRHRFAVLGGRGCRVARRAATRVRLTTWGNTAASVPVPVDGQECPWRARDRPAATARHRRLRGRRLPDLPPVLPRHHGGMGSVTSPGCAGDWTISPGWASTRSGSHRSTRHRWPTSATTWRTTATSTRSSARSRTSTG